MGLAQNDFAKLLPFIEESLCGGTGGGLLTHALAGTGAGAVSTDSSAVQIVAFCGTILGSARLRTTLILRAIFVTTVQAAFIAIAVLGVALVGLVLTPVELFLRSLCAFSIFAATLTSILTVVATVLASISLTAALLATGQSTAGIAHFAFRSFLLGRRQFFKHASIAFGNLYAGKFLAQATTLLHFIGNSVNKISEITDSFMDFHYKFMNACRPQLEPGRTNFVYNIVKERLSDIVESH